MNPFRRKINQDDLIAHHLRELSPRRERSVHRALQTDPTLAAESEAIAQTLALFPPHESSIQLDNIALDSYWLTLRPSLTPYPAQETQPNRYRRPLLAGIGIAALIATTFFVVLVHRPIATPASPAIASPAASTLTIHSQSNQPPLRNPPLNPFAPHALRRSALSLLAAPLLMAPSLPAQSTQIHPPEITSSSQPLPLSNDSSTSTEPGPSTVAPARTTQPTPPPSTHKQADISVGIFGNFLAARNQNIVSGSGSTLSESSRSQSASPSAGVAVTFHQQLHPWLGYQITAAYTRSTYSYTYTSANATSALFSGGSIGTHVAEFSAAYVVQGPHSQRVSTFADLGGGVLAFVPTPTPQNVSYGFRPTETVGLGLNYRLTPHLSLRAEYRGLFFKTPDFRYSDGNLPVTTRYTLTSEPTVSLTWNLGKQSVNK